MQSSTSALYHAELQAFIQVHAELMRILHVLRDVEPQTLLPLASSATVFGRICMDR